MPAETSRLRTRSRRAAHSATIPLPMSEFFDTSVRVRYAETDKMGVVYYANYYIYFEIGRVEYMRQRGVDYRQMEIEDDSFIVVAESKCRYRRPARYDDPLRIRTRVTSGEAPRDYVSATKFCTTKPESCWSPAKRFTSSATATADRKPLPEKYRRILISADKFPRKRDLVATGFSLWVLGRDRSNVPETPHRLKPVATSSQTSLPNKNESASVQAE